MDRIPWECILSIQRGLFTFREACLGIYVFLNPINSIQYDLHLGVFRTITFFVVISHQAEISSYHSWLNNFQPIKSQIIIISCILSTVKLDGKDLYRQLMILNDYLHRKISQNIDCLCLIFAKSHCTSVTATTLVM